MNPVLATLFVILTVVVTLLAVVAAIAWYAFSSIAQMLLLRRAGHPRPWGAWIPIYRDWALLEAGGQAGWWGLLGGIPLLTNALAMWMLLTVSIFTAFPGAVPVNPSLNVLIALGAVALLLLLIPRGYASLNLNRGFGKRSPWWTVFAILLPAVWAAVLSFRQSQFYRPELARGPYFWGSPRRSTRRSEDQ
ncbi:MAG: DUF5684 domain-containing protein [Microbacteriaceae bacterium]|jgi:hypothetical protein|nr:DUF5684 domain-containing protein [Microbacteriaceae bacterium]MCI1207648.1 DUF5684 domain-containing protein [Microbacteriaceae bacterium]